MNPETAIVVLIVLAFAVRGAQQLFPVTARRLGARLRARLGLKPTVLAEAGGSCASGCGTCGSCGSTPAPHAAEQPLRFEPPRR